MSQGPGKSIEDSEKLYIDKFREFVIDLQEDCLDEFVKELYEKPKKSYVYKSRPLNLWKDSLALSLALIFTTF